VGDVSALNQAGKDHAEGKRERAAIIDYLTDVLTDPRSPLTTEQMIHFRMSAIYFPEAKEYVFQ
jgi:hypothetical protein